MEGSGKTGYGVRESWIWGEQRGKDQGKLDMWSGKAGYGVRRVGGIREIWICGQEKLDLG